MMTLNYCNVPTNYGINYLELGSQQVILSYQHYNYGMTYQYSLYSIECGVILP